MAKFITFTLYLFGIIGFFRGFGLLLGIGLIVFWWTKVKNTVALFYDPKKIRATIFFFVPGLILLVLGLYFRLIWRPSYDSDSYSSYDSETEYVPTLARVYIANYAEETGRIQVGSFRDSLSSKESKTIDIPSKLQQDTLRLWVGDSLVLDTVISGGSYIANFSDDITVSAEEVVYSSYETTNDDAEFKMLSKPGIEQFSTSTYEDVYGFGLKAPETVSVSSSTSTVHKWDVETMDDSQLMQLLLDAVRANGGSLEDEGDE